MLAVSCFQDSSSTFLWNQLALISTTSKQSMAHIAAALSPNTSLANLCCMSSCSQHVKARFSIHFDTWGAVAARSKRTWRQEMSKCFIGRTALLPTLLLAMPTRPGGPLPCATPQACSQTASMLHRSPNPQGPSRKAMYPKDQVSHTQ